MTKDSLLKELSEIVEPNDSLTNQLDVAIQLLRVVASALVLCVPSSDESFEIAELKRKLNNQRETIHYYQEQEEAKK